MPPSTSPAAPRATTAGGALDVAGAPASRPAAGDSAAFRPCWHLHPRYAAAMTQIETVERAIRALPREQVRELQEWLQQYLEDLEEMRPEFTARLDRAQQQLEAGEGRTVPP